jgi:polysaccharide deacetylase family protein (PEP-CTERM system associated)
MLNALTIDVEDYYHVSAFESVVKFEEWGAFASRVERNTERILELLDIFKVRATFFILGWVAERSSGLVKKIQREGHEIACHGYRHQLVYKIGQEKFREDIKRGKRILEDIIGDKVVGYRAPSYSITKESLWGLDILAEEGYKYDSSIFPIIHDRYGIPDFGRFPQKINLNGKGNILEFPLSTIRLFNSNFPIAGGGYFRLFPYTIFKRGIKRINIVEKQPVIFYFHPWEIDPEQPVLKVKLRTRLRHYINLKKTEGRLKRLLSDFRWGRVLDVIGEI